MKPRSRALAAAVVTVLAQPGSVRGVERVALPEPEPPQAGTTGILAVPQFLQQLGIETWWDVVQFQPWTASLGLAFDAHEQRLKSPRLPTERSSSRLGTETFTIQNDGFSIVDRRLFTGSLLLGTTIVQERQRVQDKDNSQTGGLVNYAFSGSFLAESPYMATLLAVRNQANYVLPSGTTTKSDYQGRSLTFHLRENSMLREKEILPYFTASLRVAEQQQRQTTTTGSQTFRQDDRRRTLGFDFQNGGETSDLSFQYQYLELDNYAYPSGSYGSQSANLFYSLDFGPTLNRRWDSRINYYLRSGVDSASDLANLEVSEFLTIDHNANRSSTYNYQLTRQDTPYGVATAHNAGAQLNEQVYGNLALTGAINASHTSLPSGTLDGRGGSGSFNYTRNLPWEGHFTFTGGAGYLENTTRVPGGIVQVVDAPYAVPAEVGAGSAILLKDRNIDRSTIVVVVIKGGARVPAYLDIDYSVRADGDRTSLVPNPASAVMLPGDPLNVAYSYLVPPDSKYATSSRSISIGGDWQWIGFYASHDQSDQKPLSGGDTSLLLDQRRDHGSVYVHGAWSVYQAKLSASIVDYDSPRLAYTERRLDEYLSYIPYPGFILSFTANQYRTQFRLPEHVTTGSTYRVDLQWNRGGWISNGYAARRTYSDTQQPSETVDEAGIRLRRAWTKLDLSLGIGVQRRVRGDVSSENGFFHFGVVRRF